MTDIKTQLEDAVGPNQWLVSTISGWKAGPVNEIIEKLLQKQNKTALELIPATDERMPALVLAGSPKQLWCICPVTHGSRRLVIDEWEAASHMPLKDGSRRAFTDAEVAELKNFMPKNGAQYLRRLIFTTNTEEGELHQFNEKVPATIVPA